jgi:ligand-binding sensor domain-containing protein
LLKKGRSVFFALFHALILGKEARAKDNAFHYLVEVNFQSKVWTYYRSTTILFIVGFGLFLITQQLRAQKPRCRNYTVEQGLPSNEVYHVLQDSKGYLWFCSDRGVSRFNGYEFENFTTEDGLIDNTVFFSYEDERGRVWFSSLSSLLCYFDGENIVPYRYNEAIEKLRLFNVPKVSMYVENETVYVGTLSSGYYTINESGQVAHNYSTKLLTVKQVGGGHLIFNSPGKSEDLRTKYGIKFQNELLQYPRDKAIMPRLITAGDTIFFSDGTNLFGFYANRIHHLLKEGHTISSISKGTNGELWLGFLERGVACYQLKDTLLEKTKHFFENTSVSWVAEDLEGGRWFTTLKKGVYYQPPNAGLISVAEQVLPKTKVEDIIIRKSGRGFVSYADGSIWEIKNQKASRIEVQQLQLNNPLAFDTTNETLITTNHVFGLFFKENERILAQIEQIRKVNYNANKKLRPDIRAIAVDNDRRIWAGTNEGLFCFKEGTLLNLFYSIFEMREQQEWARRYKVDALFATKQNYMLMSSLEGLYKVKDTAVLFLGDQYPLFRCRIDEIKEWNTSTILLGTRGRGIIVWTGDSTYSIRVKEGLSNNFINSLAVDAKGRIWAGTNDGLDRIELRNDTIIVRKLTTVHGLRSNCITKVALNDNELLVGTLNGLSIFNINDLEINTFSPIMVINGVEVKGKEMRLDTALTLPYTDNSLSFSLTGIAYKSGGQVSYQYFLEGSDQHWTSTTNREVRYNSLPHGVYVFKARAANEDGYWSEPQRIVFEILPPFWLKWWFIASMSLLGSLLILVVLRKRDERVREKSEFHKRAAQLELKALRAQMNPHFTFNTLSSIQQFILTNDSLSANDYLSQFAALIRKVLENSRYQEVCLLDEIEMLKIYLNLEKLRFSDKLECRITVDETIKLEETEVPPALIQPFIENSIVHGIANKKGNGRIELDFVRHGDGIKCTITDDGIGREKAKEIKKLSGRTEVSMGLEITKDRLELMGNLDNSNCHFTTTDLYNESGKAIGTKVEVFISSHPKNKTKND